MYFLLYYIVNFYNCFFLISKDNNKGINSLTQMFNGSLISGGDDFKINIFE